MVLMLLYCLLFTFSFQDVGKVVILSNRVTVDFILFRCIEVTGF